MRLVILFLISCPAFAEYEFEKSKYSAGITCNGMVGTWFTDVTTLSEDEGKIRHITKLVRYEDGTAKLEGLSIYIDLNEFNPWQFASTWSCVNDWYTEKNEWGYTSFKIVSMGTENVLKDELGNLGPSKVKVVEKANMSFDNKAIEQYFGVE